MYTDLSGWILIVCTSAVLVVAAWIDYRHKLIPNKLTLPTFALGWVFQIWAHGLPGLLDGLAGFVVGFGVFFLLWLIGGGGGGDAKLAGAISVWLGFQMTIGMIVVSTIFVLIGTGLVMLYGMLTKGVYKTKEQMLPGTGSKKHMELLKFNRNRKGMTFALSMALATICVTLFAVPDWPYRKAQRERAARLQQQLKQDAEQHNAPDAGPVEEQTAEPEKTSKKPEDSQKN